MTCSRIVIRILPLTVVIILLVSACASPSTEVDLLPSPVSTEIPPTEPREPEPSLDTGPLPTEPPESAPADAEAVRLRIEYEITSILGTLEITGMEDASVVRIIESQDAAIADANSGLISMELGGADQASMVVEVELPANNDRMVTITSKNDPPGGSIASIYLLPKQGDPILLQQLDHRWWTSNNLDTSQAAFTVDLGRLTSQPFDFFDPVVSRPAPTCWQTILADTTLTSDLDCSQGDPREAIVLGASNITLDLGGHTLSGTSVGGEFFKSGIHGNEVDDITIRNGTIDGFDAGIYLLNAHRVLMENLTIRNLENTDPDVNINAISIAGSEDVVVRDSTFEFPPVLHKESAAFGNTRNITVRDNIFQGGGIGVGFGFAQICDPESETTNGSVINNSFSDLSPGPAGIAIFIQCTSDAEILDNVISGTMIGIAGDSPYLGAVTNLVIEGNTVHGGLETSLRGIVLYATSGARVANNVVSGFHFGISTDESYGCLVDDPYWECAYSTGNEISGNEALGNGTDLYHHELSTGNSWGENTCETKKGIEIPECTPPNP